MKAAALSLLLLAAPAVAAPPDPGTEDASIMSGHRAWIEGQRTWIGVSCCSWADGRPVMDNELRRRNGQWEVFWSRAHWADAPEGGMWLQVPDGAVLPAQSPVFFPIAWIMAGRVWCLALAGAA